MKGSYLPFDTCTKLAIKHAFALEGLRLQDEDYDELTNWFASYNTKFEDAEVFLRYVAPGLTKTLQDRGNKGHILSILVFTNGDPGMIGQAVDDSAYMEEVFGPSDGPSRELGADNVRVLPPCSVHGVKAYKPHPAAYNYLRCKWIPEHSVAKSEVPAEVFLVSSNEWDVAGAESAGLGTIWVDRARKGRMDALGMELRSGSGGFVINGLQEVGRVVEKILSGEKPNVDAMSDI